MSATLPATPAHVSTHRDGHAAKNNKVLGAHHHESRKLVAQDLLNLVGLLDRDGHADRVDRGLDEDLLSLVTRDHQWLEQDLWRLAATVSSRPAVNDP